MRVLAMTNLYPNPFQPHRAPFNRHQLRLLNDLVPVRVVAPIAWTDEVRARRAGAEQLPPGRRVTLDGLTVDHPRYLFSPKALRAEHGRFYLWSVGPAVRRAVAEFRPTVLFCPWAFPDGWAGIRMGRAAGVPVVVQVHGSDIKLLANQPGRRTRTAATLKAADGVVAVSRDLATDVIALGADPGRVRVVYDGVDPAVFSPGDRAAARLALGLPAGDPVVLFVGNLIPTKGVDLLLTAAATLAADGRLVRVLVVGQGPSRGTLEQQAAALGLTDRVRFTGAVAQSSLPDYYRAADVFALPSYSEGVPNVLLEAGACGIPWVATAVGGIPEITDRGAAILIPPGDAGALAAALRTAIESPPRPPAGPPKPRTAAVEELRAFLSDVSSRV